MSDKTPSRVFWEYAVLQDDRWTSASASGQDPHRYESREELLRIMQIIHPGERVRLLRVEEITVPES